jgi:mannose-6-phosphate isomerase-like protein (cupin superfamily)
VAVKVALGEALAALDARGTTATVGLSRGALELLLYRPRRIDFQTAHERDELYVVAGGSATLVGAAPDEQPLGPGDVVFVAAGVSHRFTRMSPDFAAWALFYGPVGGERDGVPQR